MTGRGKLSQVLAVLVPLLVALGAGWLLFGRVTGHHLTVRPGIHHAPAASSRPPARPERLFHAAMNSGWLNGVAVARDSALPAWTRATGERPAVVVVYTALTGRFPTAEVRQIASQGALPLLQVNPRGVPLDRIAAGDEAGLLARYAADIHHAGVPLALSFAHEANGDWYPWGCRHTPARVYVAAWRRFHEAIGAKGVTWVWTVDRWHGHGCPVMARYPGPAWVDWIGVDGYLRHKGETFASIFGAAVRVLKGTGKPVLLAEVGAPAVPGQPGLIASLFGGARTSGCLGVVWFDSATRKGDYKPQDHPAALGAFRSALAGQYAPSQPGR